MDYINHLPEACAIPNQICATGTTFCPENEYRYQELFRLLGYYQDENDPPELAKRFNQAMQQFLSKVTEKYQMDLPTELEFMVPRDKHRPE